MRATCPEIHGLAWMTTVICGIVELSMVVAIYLRISKISCTFAALNPGSPRSNSSYWVLFCQLGDDEVAEDFILFGGWGLVVEAVGPLGFEFGVGELALCFLYGLGKAVVEVVLVRGYLGRVAACGVNVSMI